MRSPDPPPVSLAEAVAGLQPVADTALLTAACRAAESKRRDGVLRDPRAEAVVEELRPVLAASGRRLHRRIARRAPPDALVSMVALRARRFDRWVAAFADRHPDGAVVSLGCGLDDRAGRVGAGRLRWWGLDAPAMVGLRHRLIPRRPEESVVAGSVLEFDWMTRVRRGAPGPLMVIAEGLLMYLDASDVRALFTHLRRRLRPTAVAVDVVHRRWSAPLLRPLAEAKMRGAGVDRAVRLGFGVDRSDDLIGFLGGGEVADEWSHLDDVEVRPRGLRHVSRWDWVRRVQWSVLLRMTAVLAVLLVVPGAASAQEERAWSPEQTAIIEMLSRGPMGIEDDFEGWAAGYDSTWSYWRMGAESSRDRETHMGLVRDFVAAGNVVTAFRFRPVEVRVEGEWAFVRANVEEAYRDPEGGDHVVHYSTFSVLRRGEVDWRLMSSNLFYGPPAGAGAG